MFAQLQCALLSVTGVDLSKILRGKPKYWGGQKVVKSDKCMGVSQLLGARARAAPKVYAYAERHTEATGTDFPPQSGGDHGRIQTNFWGFSLISDAFVHVCTLRLLFHLRVLTRTRSPSTPMVVTNPLLQPPHSRFLPLGAWVDAYTAVSCLCMNSIQTKTT